MTTTLFLNEFERSHHSFGMEINNVTSRYQAADIDGSFTTRDVETH